MVFICVDLSGIEIGMLRILLCVALKSDILEGVEKVYKGVYYAICEPYQVDMMQQFTRLLTANEIYYEAPD